MFITRKKTLEVDVGWVKIGWWNPIVIQSMTNTLTSDIDATVYQIKELADSGSELVRITVNDDVSAKSVPEIVTSLKKLNCFVPLIWDFHYNGHILLNKYPEMAQSLSKFRVNPGNVWKWEKHDENFKQIIECAIKYQKPIRIWINWGSLDEDLLNVNMEKNSKLKVPKSSKEVFINSMVESALLSIKKAEEFGLPRNKIIVATKVSDVQDLITINEKLSKKTDCPLHLWLTEAGGSIKWIVSSSAALWILLQQGIGDTIRVSITPEPGQPRSREVEVCKYLLQSMNFRYFQPMVISCPGCGRTSSDRFQILAKQIGDEINLRLPVWKSKYYGFEKTNIAVMWCIVNWIWESKQADIWIFFPGNVEKPIIPVYVNGVQFKTFWLEDDILSEFMKIVESYFEKKII